MILTNTWSDLVAAADPALVLPSGDRRAEVEVPGPLCLDALLDLGDDHAVAVVRSADAARWTVPLVRGGAESQGTDIRRSRPGDGTAERLVALLSAVAGGAVAVDSPFVIEGFAAAAGAGTSVSASASASAPASGSETLTGERGITVDQTNESVIVGERVVVKWAVRLPADGEPGSPAARRLAALERGGFPDMPRAWGLLDLLGPVGGQPVLLAGVVEYLPGAVDGWEWAVEDVRRFARGGSSLAESVAPAERLGAVTARMHAALAAEGRTPASAEYLEAWLSRVRAELREAVATVTGDEGVRLRSWEARIARAYSDLDELVGSPLIDVHGDFHVGQVLRAADRYAVVDFDGNPVLTPGQRAARQPAALDVAGMAASLDHVGRVVLFRTADADPALVRSWIAAAQDAYLAAYRTTLAEARAADLLDERWTRPLRLAQEVREYLYAVRHLPHWVYVPDMALADLLPEE